MRQTKPPGQRRERRDLNETVAKAARLLSTAALAMGLSDDEARRWVRDAIKEALEGGREWEKWETLPGETAPRRKVNGAGILRLVFQDFGVDRADQGVQETLFDVAVRAADAFFAERTGSALPAAGGDP